MNSDTIMTEKSFKSALKEQLISKIGVFIGLFLMCLVFQMMKPIYLSWSNIANIFIQSGTNAVIAAGMTFVIISGCIDLSVGSTVALASVVGADIMLKTGNVWLGILVTLLIGVICGLLNGVLVAYLDLPPFIVTLSTMWLFRGTAYVLTQGQARVNLPEANMELALGNFLGIPYIIWLILIVFFICWIVLSRLTIGRKIYATGDNAESARLSGINVKAIKTMVFTISGFLAALGGVILMSRLNSGQPVAGQTFELSAIAAAVIGGTSLTKGGVGGVGGTLIGVVFISALLNGLTIINAESFWIQVYMGIVVLIAVGIDRFKKRK